MDMLLKGKVALVTGAARDVGREIAISLAAEGVAVAVNYNGSREGAESVVAEIEKAGGKAKAYKADVRYTRRVGCRSGQFDGLQ